MPTAHLFHGDSSGKINAAEKEMMAARRLASAKIDMNSDELFWLDPWSAQGQDLCEAAAASHELRLHAERAIVLVARCAPPIPDFSKADALTAMDLGARRLDLIGLKFELSPGNRLGYATSRRAQHDKTQRDGRNRMLEEISSDNGRCQDLRDAYSRIKAEYSQVWLGENRPYWLNNVTVRYDLEIERWQRRGNQFETAVRAWRGGQDLPAASSLG
jgi:hexosaminidase